MRRKLLPIGFLTIMSALLIGTVATSQTFSAPCTKAHTSVEMSETRENATAHHVEI